MENITIVPVYPDDTSSIVELLNEVDSFYGDELAEGAEERAEHVKKAVFGEAPSASMIVAKSESGEILGFASYSFLWPAAGSSRSLFLKELYVRGQARRRGIGKVLMQELLDIAKRQSCSRVEWVTDRSNLSAQRFYEGIGFSSYEGKVLYRYET